ncbi:hypothetical protein [Neorhizobium tomejilense]|uniref:hypothetical protein n=1 Tax=Neorhizobium tomejilense TaxID=2093828 RepID=UPI000CF91A0A|nr:hypothetical protein [Neorhizobium tomejilense]
MTEQSIGALALKIVDPWKWWQTALKDPSKIGSKDLPVHDSDPQQGYFRVRYSKDKPFEPVAIWKEDGAWLAYRAGREVKAEDIWTSCCRHPISHAAYEAAIDGKGWPDDDATVAAQVKPPEPGIGDNSAPVDEADVLKDQIESALKGIDAYKKITDDATASKAQSLRNRLNELSGDADKKRDELKRPHLEAGKVIDKHWMPLVKSAKEGANAVKAAMDAYETEKLRKRREEERKAEEARIAAEAAARAAQPEGEVLEAPKVETQPAPPPEPVGQIRATYGKAASVSVKIVVDQVTDWPALATYMSTHPECQDLLRKLAQRALDAGRTAIPGITTTEAAKVS